MTAASFKFTHDKKEGVVDVEVLDRKDGKTYPQLAVVHRLQLKNWKAGPGSYILVNPVPDGEGRYGVYVGEATKRGVGERIKTHASNPPSGMEAWIFAVAVHGTQQGDKPKGLAFEQAQALEHFLYKKLISSESSNKSVNVENKNFPEEVPLTEKVRDELKHFVSHAIELLKILGCDTSEKPKSNLTEKIDLGYRKRYSTNQNSGGENKKDENGEDESGEAESGKAVTVADLIQVGLIKVGEELVSKSNKYPCEAKIVDKEGNIQVLRYGKDDKGEWKHNLSEDPAYNYKTLSGATKVIMIFGEAKNHADGWRFWRLAKDPKVKMKDIRYQYLQEKAQKT